MDGIDMNILLDGNSELIPQVSSEIERNSS